MAKIEKQHNPCLVEVFNSADDFLKHECECEIYKTQFEDIISALNDAGYTTTDKFGTFCPELQYIRMDMLKKEDWPHHIDRNSIFITYEIDMCAKTVEVSTFGHIYLSDEDSKKSHLAMCSMKQAHQAIGGKWMRRSKYKSAADLAKKMVAFYNSVKQTMEEVTNGYPYKQMKINIY